jgi:hypothetical protein
MVLDDFFREELAFGEGKLCYLRIVGLAYGVAHVCGLEHRAILLEEPLMIAEVVREDYMMSSSISLSAHLP